MEKRDNSKKTGLLVKIYHMIGAKYHRLYWIFMAKLFPKHATKTWYKKRMGKKLNLNDPQTLSEKFQYLKLNNYYHNPIVTQCADKYAVRDYVVNHGCGNILNELFAVYDSVDDIQWELLPNTFALKCNHGCGGNILCYDKKSLDISKAKQSLNKWMKHGYGLEHVEYSYEKIPRKIICEKLIESEDGLPPRDYKFFCSYGTPMLIYMITGRKENEEYLDYYTTEWEWIPVQNGVLPNAKEHPSKPEKLDEMMSYASLLSKDFPLVRVDLYCEFGKITFGELTFLPTGGCFRLNPQKYDYEFGQLFPDVPFKKPKTH